MLFDVREVRGLVIARRALVCDQPWQRGKANKLRRLLLRGTIGAAAARLQEQ
jgi:hypothetical protein